jgi:prepilin-type N-terminal cleavage/methylation domain-containing protein
VTIAPRRATGELVGTKGVPELRLACGASNKGRHLQSTKINATMIKLIIAYNLMSLEYGKEGFTLIELSIVLVIIGLLVGGILVGQDLIKAAEVRAQISQIEKYNQAVNTFRAKFGGLPGDLAVGTANQFGFVTTSCDGGQGERDGNGLIDGFPSYITVQGVGETALFWGDLSSPAAGDLIEGSFPNSGAAAFHCAGSSPVLTATPGTTYIGDYFPLGKIGHGTFVYTYENNGYNWYGLSAITSEDIYGNIVSTGTIPVTQTYNIDKKIDDGLPMTGSVMAVYLFNQAITNSNNAAADNTTTCYNTTSNVYSIGSAANYGSGGNCALSFRFQ